MKVIHKQRVSDRIIEASEKARQENKQIDRIEVTPDEFDRLLNEVRPYFYGSTPQAMRSPLNRGHRHILYHDVLIQDYEGER